MNDSSFSLSPVSGTVASTVREQAARHAADPETARAALRETLRLIRLREPEIAAFASLAEEPPATGEGAKPAEVQGALAGIAVGVGDQPGLGPCP